MLRSLTIILVILFASACAIPEPNDSLEKKPANYIEYKRPDKSEVVKHAPKEQSKPSKPLDYGSSIQCRGCHVKIFEQHSESMHAKSFTNKVFQAQYTKELLPKTKNSPDMATEAKACIACHAPISSLRSKGTVITKEQVDINMSGVTCDFCHSISAYEGDNPGDGRYVSTPGEQKLGPFKTQSSWHRKYSELHTKSEFCGICHNWTNHKGLEIKSTFSEWKESTYAKDGVQCQDCHMNKYGFLNKGKAEFESGKAAEMTLGTAQKRDKIYTHRFPGAHSKTQVAKAITLAIESDIDKPSAGDIVTLKISVNNSKTGHKMPSGSAELRILLLDVTAKIDNKIAHIPPLSKDVYNVSGSGNFDKKILGKSIPTGRRAYRAILVDKTGTETLYSYDAQKIGFDNRLDAGEIRIEVYRFRIPKGADGNLSIKANLNYYHYPELFAKNLGLPNPEAIEIATVERLFTLK